MADKTPHDWTTSKLGHGEQQCRYCLATNREVAVIGDLNHCPDRAANEVDGDPMKFMEAD